MSLLPRPRARPPAARCMLLLLALPCAWAGAAPRAGAPITALALAPDGKSLVTASQAGVTVWPWPLVSGAAASSVSRKSALPNLHCLAFAPDGKTLAAGGGVPAVSGTVELRAWPGQNVLGVLGGHSDVVMAVAFRPDGRLLASGGADSMIRLFDTGSRQELRALAGHAGPVLALAFSPDGKWLASAGADGSIKLWEAASGQLLRTLTNHLGPVHAVTFHPEGRSLASASADMTVRVWQPEIGRLVRIVRGHASPVMDLCYTPDGECLVSVAQDGRARLIAGDRDEILRTLPGSGTWLYAVAATPEGTLVAGDAAGQLWVWDLAEGRLLWPVRASGATTGRGDTHAKPFSPGIRVLPFLVLERPPLGS